MVAPNQSGNGKSQRKMASEDEVMYEVTQPSKKELNLDVSSKKKEKIIKKKLKPKTKQKIKITMKIIISLKPPC